MGSCLFCPYFSGVLGFNLFSGDPGKAGLNLLSRRYLVSAGQIPRCLFVLAAFLEINCEVYRKIFLRQKQILPHPSHCN
jgi:hypothetical protein